MNSRLAVLESAERVFRTGGMAGGDGPCSAEGVGEVRALPVRAAKCSASWLKGGLQCPV